MMIFDVCACVRARMCVCVRARVREWHVSTLVFMSGL